MSGRPGRPKGIPKTGGRTKGTLNKDTHAKRAALQRTRDLSAEAVVEQIRRNALFDPRRLFDKHGNLKPVTELTEADAAMIEGIDVVRRPRTDGEKGTEEVVKLKIAGRSAYVRMAGEVHGIFVERREHSGPDGAPLLPTVVTHRVMLGPEGAKEK